MFYDISIIIMEKIKLTNFCVRRTHLNYVVLTMACFILNACSNDEETSKDSSLSLEYNLNVVDNDTIAYDVRKVAEPFNGVEEKINSALEDYAVTMLVDNCINTNKNTVLSPMSATLLYSMISNLSDNSTDYDCKKQLGIEKFDDEDVNSYCRKLNYQTKQFEKTTADGSKVSMSSNCWIQEKENVYKSFISMSKSYGINVKGLDFKKQSGVDAIETSLNGLAFSNSNETEKTPLGNVTSVVTMSADVKKKWKNKLYYDSSDSVFYNADGTRSICRKIWDCAKVKYTNQSTFDMFELPYTDDSFSLYIVYPHSNNLLATSLKYIQDNGLEKCIGEMKETEISFHIPAFELKGVTELNSSNSSSASGERKFYQAKLTKASSKGFNIGNTYQAYSIRLDENGTSFIVESHASGITPISVGQIGASPGIIHVVSVPHVHIDHPFFIFIRNNKINTTIYACCIKSLRE